MNHDFTLHANEQNVVLWALFNRINRIENQLRLMAKDNPRRGERQRQLDRTRRVHDRLQQHLNAHANQLRGETE